MLRTSVLLQMTLWAATIHGFVPWMPCELDRNCHKSRPRTLEGESSSPHATIPRGQSFDILRVPNAHVDGESPAARAIRLASRLTARRGATSLTKRANQYPAVAPLDPKAPNTAGIFQDGWDYSYWIQVKVGTPGKPLYMLLDSGAGRTWVMARSCTEEACKLHETFGPEDSKTLKLENQTYDLDYGTGNVTCQVARDKMTVAGVTVDVSFGLATYLTEQFVHFPFDGILGLSMHKGTTDAFMTAMLGKKDVAAQVFGVSLSKASDVVNNGQITFGGVDPTQFTGDISYSPVSPAANGDWAIPIQGFGPDGKSAALKVQDAIIDTGTSMIFGPPDDVAAFHKSIAGAKTEDNVTYTVPCSTMPLTVKFGGVTYSIPAKDWQTPWETGCVSNIFGKDVASGRWLFGAVFLKHVYTIFDIGQKRVGFATKVAPPPAPKDSTGKPTGTGPGLAPVGSPFVPSAGGSKPTSGQEAAPAKSAETVSLGGQLQSQGFLSVLSAVAIVIAIAA